MSDLLVFSPTTDQPPVRTAPAPKGPSMTGFWCGLLGLLPGVGLVLGPVALKLGARDLRRARQDPRAPTRGPALAAVILGALALGVQLASVGALFVLLGDGLWGMAGLEGRPNSAAPAPDDKPPAKPGEVKRVRMGENVVVEIQGDQRRVLVNAHVCLREGQLEQLLTRKLTKEHEAILAAEVDARHIHAGLLLAGAKEGSPVKFAPRYEPAKGSPIKITLQYEEKGKLVEVSARQWVRNTKTGKDLDFDWVFAGSRLVDVPFEQNKKHYLANDGDVICVSNFDTAMLDLPIKSPKDNADLAFEAHTNRIPPLNTKVTVILEVLPQKK